LTRSAAPSPAFESGVEKRRFLRQAQAEGKPQPPVLSVVEGLGWEPEGLTF